MEMKIIITGATGMVGEGVLFECLAHPGVKQVLMVNRRLYTGAAHPKLKELVVPDFFNMTAAADELAGYDACFYCAGISSRGMNESDYSYITYDTTMHFANQLINLNPGITFNFVSGAHTDSSEKGKIMWARVKGKTENALAQLPFKKVYSFRPGFMKPMPGQKNIKGYYKIITGLYPVLSFLFPNQGCTLHDVGLSMINAVLNGYDKPVLEVKDIKLLALA